jgi:hypothetical protein
MEEGVRTSPRRSILKRGLLVVGGAIGLGSISRVPEARAQQAEGRSDAPASTTLTLHGRDWHLFAADLRRGEVPEKGDRVAVYGELLAQQEGEKVGEFYASCVVVNSPFGVSPLAAASLEIHTFNLADGTITGMGTALADESVFAIIGGTGRYLGARGSYVARQQPIELGGDGTARFDLTLVGE